MNEKSKQLSFLLRHVEADKLKLTQQGWARIADLVSIWGFTHEELLEIVATSDKNRFAISEDGLCIRARQGHSTSQVKLTFEKTVPPTILYHGTINGAIWAIEKEGLKPMKRHHVHLSADLQVALDVGDRRKGKTTVFQVDAKAMLSDGHDFFISENGVWLVDSVPPQYLKRL